MDSNFNEKPEIAIYHPDSNEVQFIKSKIVSFNYQGDMYLWESNRIAQFSTPEHRNLCTDSHGNKKVRFVADIPCKAQIPVCGHYVHSHPTRFSDDELRLLVAYQADGIQGGGKRTGLAFRFSKERKILRMRTLLTRLDYCFQEYKHSDGATCFRVAFGEYNPNIKTKQFGYWLLDENPNVFFEELSHWDGNATTTNSTQYATTNRLNAEIIATFAHLSGRAATINRCTSQNTKQRICYFLQIWSNVMVEGICIQNAPRKICDYSGKVYCAETTSGFFLIRKDNKIWVTGNSGRLLQPQNLPQNHMPDLAQARELVRSGNFTAMDFLYNSIPEVLSELIRTAFVPRDGYKFVVCDFSSIEAVVLGWLAGEKWVLNAYSANEDLYIKNAERMFSVPVGSIDKKSNLRQKSKIAVLACGYQGSVGALKSFGAVEMGINEKDLQPLVDAWRSANPNIVKFWWDADRAAISAVKNKATEETNGIKFSWQSGMLFITLPSGRRLTYIKPKIGENRFGNRCVTYEGLDAAKKWSKIESSPGKWVENITQAVARDILYYAMNTLRHCFIVMHVHDEVVLEADMGMCVKAVCEQMSRTPAWAKGLPLHAEGFETNFYLKD